MDKKKLLVDYSDSDNEEKIKKIEIISNEE